ncbi:GNAT family N-acetyltransferase [Salinibacterium sp.]|uniref:GNAT family N-acetyltransferase n=1 Tax=Salinibacterium sp. TaxID=1915057 RepID=UPI00286A4ABA|nr:GNAT family N-acetyltransferase [Salinibacterium sp.]
MAIVTVRPRDPVTPSSGSLDSGNSIVRQRLSRWGVRTPRLLRGPRVEVPLTAPVIQTARLVIRPHRLSDAETWFDIQSDEGVLTFLSWPHRNRAQSFQHLKDRTRHTTLSQADDLLALAIERDGKLIGDLSVHLRTVHPDFRSAEIGWILASSHGGAGLATEAVCAVIDLMFGRLDIKWMLAIVDIRNERSLALATRLGFIEVSRDGRDLTMMMSRDQRNFCPDHSGQRSLSSHHIG